MKNAFLALPLAALVFLGAGCGNSSGVTPSDVISGDVARCGNAYFPLRQGYAVTYRNTFPGGAPNEYTLSVERVEGNEIELKTAFQSGTTGTQTLECEDGVVRAKSFIALGGPSSLTGQAKTTAVRGELMPRDLRVGSAWETEFDVDVKITDPLKDPMVDPLSDPLASGRATRLGTTIKIAREALAEESVTVPAGTFRALKIRSVTTGMGFPITSNEWWVEGSGLVKVTTGDDQSIVSEAISVRLP